MAERISDYNVYTDGMRKSMTDKIWFIDKIDDVTDIVDYGCADGALLQYISEAMPNVFNLSGIDIDEEMLNLARKRLPFFNLQTPNQFMETSIMDTSTACLNCGSVIHEVYSYGTNESISAFWNFAFNSDFKYIAIRDMAISKIDVVKKRRTTDNVLTLIKHYNLIHADAQERFNDFCKINNIKERSMQWRDIVHYLLKYRYVANWTREVKENYLPLMIEEILLKIPSDKYRVKYFEHYTLPYLKDKLSEDFDLDLRTPTHFKLLLERI